jgi:hypothetical protein
MVIQEWVCFVFYNDGQVYLCSKQSLKQGNIKVAIALQYLVLRYFRNDQCFVLYNKLFQGWPLFYAL